MKPRDAAMLAATLAAACSTGRAPPLGDEVTVVGNGASNPTLAVDPAAGTFYVAWVGTEAGQSNVYLARSFDAATFRKAVRVNDVPGDAAPHEQAPAQVAVGPEGHVYIAWQNNTAAAGRFPYSDIRLARSTNGGETFEPAITVNDDADGPPASHTFHDIEVGPDGVVYVSWIDSRARPAMRADSGVAPPGPDIRVARSSDHGVTFEPSVVVASDACPCCRTALAAGAGGKVWVAWRDVGPGGVRDIVVARSDDRGRSFRSPVVVHADRWKIDGCPHAGPGLAVDGAGRLHVAWYTAADGRAGLHRAVSRDGGGSFGPPAPLVTGAWVPVSHARVAAAGDAVWLVWEDRRLDPSRIAFATLAAADMAGAARWQTSDIAGSDLPFAGTGTSPAIAAAGALRAIAWLDGGAIRFRGTKE